MENDESQYPYTKNDQGAQSTEIDYGDIPENMNEQAMREYLALESKLVMPNENKRDSFEQQWNQQRAKYQPQQPQQQQQQQQQQQISNYQHATTSSNGMNFAFQQKPNYKNTGSSTASKATTQSTTAYSQETQDYDPS